MSNQNLSPQVAQQGAVAKKQETPLEQLKFKLGAESVQQQFKNALGKHSDVFIASLIELFTRTKGLQECNVNLVITEALSAAAMNLPINKSLGFAYIMPFKNKGVPTPTFVPGYKGYIQLAMRTGQYKTINADYVYEGELSKRDRISGEIHLDGERVSDKVVGYFAYIKMINGFEKSVFMTVEEVAKHAKLKSPSLKFDNRTTVEQLIELGTNNIQGDTVGWKGSFGAMALKTVIRRLLSQYGYLSIEMQGVMAKDIESDFGDVKFEGQKKSAAELAAEIQDAEEVHEEETDAIPAEKTEEVPQSNLFE